MEHYYAVIMAGGSGTRLWPMSRQHTPKQLLPLVENKSMFRVSVERLAPLFTPDRIYVVTGREHATALRTEAPEIPDNNFIVEPYGKDSGPAAGLAVTVIHQRDPEATVAILTADHHIADKEGFRRVLAAGYELAQQGYIVTLGIAPSYPATGFGYIRQGEELGTINGFTCYRSRGFTEKPNIVTATAFLASGEYSWNSGMFIWRTDKALSEFQRQRPEMYAQFMTLAPTVDTPEFETTLLSIWERIPERISLDYAIMENAQDMAVIPIDVGWSDIGSWAALFDILPSDKFGNCFKGNSSERIILDTRSTLIYSDKLTVLIGVRDLIVVDTPDALLICHREHSEEVKDVVKHLQASNNHKYL